MRLTDHVTPNFNNTMSMAAVFSEVKTQAIYFFRCLKVSDDVLQLNGRRILFVNNVTFLGVAFAGG
jgi:hypothetical protein